MKENGQSFPEKTCKQVNADGFPFSEQPTEVCLWARFCAYLASKLPSIGRSPDDGLAACAALNPPMSPIEAAKIGKIGGSNSQPRLFVRCSMYLQMRRCLLRCWFFTSSWVWRRAAWCSVGAAGHPAGSCGASASVASCPAATQPARRANSAPAAAHRARSTVWPRSPHTPRSTGPPPVPRILMALIRMLPCQRFRKRTGTGYAVAARHAFTASGWAKLITSTLCLHSVVIWISQKAEGKSKFVSLLWKDCWRTHQNSGLPDGFGRRLCRLDW